MNEGILKLRLGLFCVRGETVTGNPAALSDMFADCVVLRNYTNFAAPHVLVTLAYHPQFAAEVVEGELVPFYRKKDGKWRKIPESELATHDGERMPLECAL